MIFMSEMEMTRLRQRAETAEAKIADMREALAKIQDLANTGMSHGLSADFTCEKIRDVADALLSRLKQEDQPASSKETTR